MHCSWISWFYNCFHKFDDSQKKGMQTNCLLNKNREMESLVMMFLQVFVFSWLFFNFHWFSTWLIGFLMKIHLAASKKSNANPHKTWKSEMAEIFKVGSCARSESGPGYVAPGTACAQPTWVWRRPCWAVDSNENSSRSVLNVII